MILLWLFAAAAPADDSPPVAVASNLSHPVREIADRFAAQTGIRVRPSFGSSGNFVRQIRQHAPFELFISADARYADRLVREGLAEGPAVTLARGRLCLFIPAGSRLEAARSLEDAMRMLAQGRFRRISMANPELAPFGAAAVEAMRAGGVWALERDRVVTGENVAQAVQFTLAGGVDAGFIPLSFAMLPEVSARGRFLAVPEQWHSPLPQCMVLIRGAGAGARRFFDYLASAPVREILERYGYETGAGAD